MVSRRRLMVIAPLATVASPFLTAAPARASALRWPLRLRGADITFTLQEEAAGVRYRDRGAVRPIEQILARRGANAVRLRVWTAPPAGYSDAAAALTLARRAKRAGLKVLLDLHYSDFWADPAHQTTPAAWQSQDLATLAGTVRTYTRELVRHFAAHGAPVDVIQVGNEITAGKLWPLGQIYQADGEHWQEFTTLLKAGIQGAREGSRDLEVMVHIDRGGDNAGSRYFFDHVLAAGAEFDIIGQSYYPFWHGTMDALQANLTDLATRYRKDLVVVETAYPWTLEDGDDLANFLSTSDGLPYPATPDGQAAYYEALRDILREVPQGRGAGFFPWEPGWLPGVGWEPGAGTPNDNLTMFTWDGIGLPSLRAFRS